MKLRIFKEIKHFPHQNKSRLKADNWGWCAFCLLVFLVIGTVGETFAQQNDDFANIEGNLFLDPAPQPAFTNTDNTKPDESVSASRWSIPKFHLPNMPNMPSVHSFLPPRSTNSQADPTSIDLPGFQGYIASPNERYAQALHTSQVAQNPQIAQSNSLHSTFLQPPIPFGQNNLFERKNTGAKMATFSPPTPNQKLDFNSMSVDYSGDTDLYYPRQNTNLPLAITAKSGWSRQVDQVQIYFLEGHCTIKQGNNLVQGSQAVLWINHETLPKTVHVYVESNEPNRPIIVELSQGKTDALIQDKKWYGTFATTTEISLNFERNTPPGEDLPAIYARAEEMRFPGKVKYRPRQLNASSQTETTGSTGRRADFRSIQFQQRSDTLTETSYRNDPITGRTTGLITNGFTIILSGITMDGAGKMLLTGDTIDISADRAVIWTNNISSLSNRSQNIQEKDIDLEIYLEGNIVFREGNRTIFAQKMYYDVKNSVGYILNAELLAPTAEYDGLIRMKTETLQQTGANKFLAKNAFVTTSRLGEPSYRIQSNLMTFEEISQPLYDTRTGAPLFDQTTGQPMANKRQLLVAENNVLCLGPVPVFYWPWMAADLQNKDPFMYIRSINVGHSGTYGAEVRTTWNAYQVFNIKNPPEGTNWDFSVDYLSKRGLGHGTNFTYKRGDFFWFPGASAGLADFWGIYDTGTDNLGYDRRELEPEANYRYRALWRHRQDLNADWTLSAELGKQSDRTFMSQFFENEWDTLKNPSTNVELKNTINNRSLSVYGAYRLDDFVTDTNQIRLNHFWMGQSLLENRLTWYEHTKVGFAQLKTASWPEDANSSRQHSENYFGYLPWELDPATGQPLSAGREVVSTKHELDLPFSVGPVRLVPYVLGELAHWGEDMDGNSAQRLYYQAGIRANLPMWKRMNFKSQTWYANGLAHKVDFEGEFFVAGSNVNWERLVQYNALDDYSVQEFRRRYTGLYHSLYSSDIPVFYDERYYAIRSGIAGNVSSPMTELADDLTLLRFGVKNRWQTKRGTSENLRIIDWITLDTHINVYPENQQNYGETLGLIDYDFRWHVGDRVALLSSGLYDLFSDGQKITRFGCLTERPGRGSFYFGVDRLDGFFTATYLNLNIAYTMNEKYSLRYGTSYDLNAGESSGHALSIVRTGESFALSLGTTIDPSRGNVGVNMSVQPIFLSGYNRRAR